MILNRSRIRLQRQIHKQALAENISKDFDPQFPLVVNWDGKLLPDISDIEKVDRLVVLVSGNGQVQLLGAPKLSLAIAAA